MALIDSPRLTGDDRAVWSRLARYDAATVRASHIARRLDRLAEAAHTCIAGFAAAGPCHIGVSWGRDSVTVAHLARDLDIELIYVTYGAREGTDRLRNPDCQSVADAYLARWPTPYREYGIASPNPYRWLEEHESPRRITGLRADESRARGMSAAVHGVVTATSCRPIIRWRSADVWAYAALHDLPLHPAYAMSFGGVIPRDRLRVSSLGGSRGAEYGRGDWEDTYYPEVRSVRDRLDRTPR